MAGTFGSQRPPSAVVLLLGLLAVVSTCSRLGVDARTWTAASALTSSTARRQLQTAVGWQLNANCYKPQNCSIYTGTCLRNITYSSTTGCGGNKTEKVPPYPTDNCRDTGCGYENCKSNEIEVSSSWCVWSFNERCCIASYTYLCRQYMSCTWVQPPNMAVFAAGGAWDGYATTDKRTNAYIATILSHYMYEESLQVTGFAAFDNAFRTRVAARMGATRAWVYYMNRDTEWVFIDTPTSVIVAFRGTEGAWSYDAWTTDLTSLGSTTATEFGGSAVYIATGFYNAFVDNKISLRTELGRFKNTSSDPSKPLWFTGHSLGGAMATLFAAYCHLNGLPVTGVYTFGSPIVGSAGWEAAYPLNARTYRYDADGDPVTVVPTTFYLNYDTHVGITVPVPPCTDATVGIAGSDQRTDGGSGSGSARRRPPRTVCGISRGNSLLPVGTQPNQPVTFRCVQRERPAVGTAGTSQAATAQTAGGGASAAGAASVGVSGTKPGGAVSTQAVSDHSIQTSYMAKVFFCMLNSTQKAVLPTYKNVLIL